MVYQILNSNNFSNNNEKKKSNYIKNIRAIEKFSDDKKAYLFILLMAMGLYIWIPIKFQTKLIYK